VHCLQILSVDPLGFDLAIGNGNGPDSNTLRIGLKVGPQTREEAISIFSKLFQEAYARQQGWQ
jgi:hypothetical protein